MARNLRGSALAFGTLAMLSAMTLISLCYSSWKIELTGIAAPQNTILNDIFKSDVAQGEQIIREMQSREHNPIFDKMLRDKKMRQTFAAALGSDLSLSKQKGHGNVLETLGSLGLLPSSHPRHTIPDSQEHFRTVPKVQIYSARKAVPHSSVPRRKRHYSIQQAHSWSKQPLKHSRVLHPNLHFSYDLFAPGVLPAIRSNFRPQNPEHHAAAASSLPHVQGHTAATTPKKVQLEKEVQVMSAKTVQLRKKLNTVQALLAQATSLNSVQQKPVDDECNELESKTLETKALDDLSSSESMKTFEEVLDEAHKMRKSLEHGEKLASECQKRAIPEIKKLPPKSPTISMPAHSKKQLSLPKSTSTLRASLPPPSPVRQVKVLQKKPAPIECAMPILAEASGIDCSNTHFRKVSVRTHVLGPSFRNMLGDIGLGDDAVPLRSHGPTKASLTSFTPAQAAVESYHQAQRSKALGFSDPEQFKEHKLASALEKAKAELRWYRQRESARHGDLKLQVEKPRNSDHSVMVHGRSAAGYKLAPQTRLQGVSVQQESGDSESPRHPWLGEPRGHLVAETLSEEAREAVSSDVSNAGDRLVPVTD